jgi:hypothetical protein
MGKSKEDKREDYRWLATRAIKGLCDREILLDIVESLLPRPRMTPIELKEDYVNEVMYCPLVKDMNDPEVLKEDGYISLFDYVEDIAEEMTKECREAIREIWGKKQVKLRDQVEKDLLVPSE